MSSESQIPIPYRCPQCHTVLSRYDLPEIWRSVQHKHSYTCGQCGGVMPAKDVNEGNFDVTVNLPKLNQLAGSPPYAFADVLSYLRTTHSESHLYRGQTRIWPGPLVPSLYRRAIKGNSPIVAPEHYRLRGLGNTFYPVLDDFGPADSIIVKRAAFNSYLVQFFGYPFGSILAQQCGISSEALDISHSVDVAALFALFDYQSRSFTESGTGIIYRVSVPDPQPGNRDFGTANFYDCPSIISALVNFYRLRHYANWEQSMAAFLEFGFQIAVKNASPKPLGILGMPISDLETCRVVQQRAALLLPDVILSKQHKESVKQPPQGKAEWDGPMLVEDIATRPGVETFEFRHDLRNQYLLTLSPDHLFPKEDGVTKLLKSFLTINPRVAFMTEFGNFAQPHVDLIQ